MTSPIARVQIGAFLVFDAAGSTGRPLQVSAQAFHLGRKEAKGPGLQSPDRYHPPQLRPTQATVQAQARRSAGHTAETSAYFAARGLGVTGEVIEQALFGTGERRCDHIGQPRTPAFTDLTAQECVREAGVVGTLVAFAAVCGAVLGGIVLCAALLPFTCLYAATGESGGRYDKTALSRFVLANSIIMAGALKVASLGAWILARGFDVVRAVGALGKWMIVAVAAVGGLTLGAVVGAVKRIAMQPAPENAGARS